MAPLVDEDSHQSDGFRNRGLPREQSQRNVGDIQQEKDSLLVVATRPTREHADVIAAVSHSLLVVFTECRIENYYCIELGYAREPID